MLKKLTELLKSYSQYLFPSEKQPAVTWPVDHFTMVEQARLEWRYARERFNQISDPDLIDHAVYDLEAAERRYVYLLKKAKEEGATIYTAADEGGG